MENGRVLPVPKISHCTICHSSILLCVLLRSVLWMCNSSYEFIILCRRVEKKNAIAIVFSDNFHRAYTLNGLQLHLFRLLTQTQRSGLPCMQNKKLKSCFALRRCRFFPHPIRNAQALAKQITSLIAQKS